jgi:two-component system chemotaxis sensor kinase CheA
VTTTPALRDFCAEADELLDAMMDGIDRLEADAGRPEARPPRLHALFRHAHSLKGLAGMSALSGIAGMAHQLEDVLDALRLGRQPWSADVMSWLRESCALLRSEARRVAEGLPPAATALRPLHAPAGPSESSGAPPSAHAGVDPALRAVLSQYEESRLDFHLHRGTPLATVRARWSVERMEAGLHELLRLMEPHGEVISTVPERTTAEGAEFMILLAGDVEAVRGAVGDSARVEPLRVPVSSVTVRPEEDLGQTLRVDIERLDPTLTRAGELVLEAGRLRRALHRALDSPTRTADLLAALRLCQQLEGLLGAHRNALLELRMIPIRRLASRLDRTVRDLSRRTAKRVAFRCLGGDTEIDKRIADTLLAALLHLVRNAVDHGIEDPDERRAAAKPEEGTIVLEAETQGRNVVLQVRDDGRGLDPQRLRQAAERLGMKTEKGDQNLESLIFEPGFSTATQVSETSGRGVGLDEVRQRLASLKGMLRMRSRPGEGMTFELVVPATLAIVPAFLVRSGPALVALPLSSVLEGRLVGGEEMKQIDRNRLLRHGQVMLPVLRLGELLGLGGGRGSAPARQCLVIARHPDGDVALAVDALVGQREVMVRPLPRRLAGHPALHGAAELEGDQVALMIDLMHLLGEGRAA